MSSKATFYYKRVFPVLFLGILVLFATLGSVATWRGGNAHFLPFVLISAFMAIMMFRIFRKLVFDLADEVWDAGDALVVRNRGQEERIALAEIMNVNYSPLVNPPRVTLSLRRPTVFGDQISFCAPLRLTLTPFSTTNPLIEELIRRIDAARERAR